MKKIFFLLFAFALLLAFSPPPLQAAPDHDQGATIVLAVDHIAPAVSMQEEGGVAVEPVADNPAVEPEKGLGDFFKDNWIALTLGLLGFIEVIVRLTPTKKDDSILNWLLTLINVVLPNNKKGGGAFGVSSK